jgi:hypothetical protein
MIRQGLDLCDHLKAEAVRFLISTEQNGGFPPFKGALPNAMTTAEVISASLETESGFSSSLLAKARERLYEWQLADGSWTDPNSDNPWDVSATAWSLWALKHLSHNLQPGSFKQGANWLKARMLADGGFPTNSLQESANSYATAYAYRALSALGSQDVAPALMYLSRAQNADGGWGLKSGDSSEPTLTAYVLHGLIDGLIPASGLVKGGISFLDHVRDARGVWGSWLNETQSVEGTAFCMYVRIRAIHDVSELDLAGLRFIARRVSDGSAWKINGEEQSWVAVSVLLATDQVRRILRVNEQSASIN